MGTPLGPGGQNKTGNIQSAARQACRCGRPGGGGGSRGGGVRFARDPGAVENHGRGGGSRGGADRDQGDLPARHAAGGDDVDLGGRAAGAAAVRLPQLPEIAEPY